MTEKKKTKVKKKPKHNEIPDEYKVETIYDFFTFSCSCDYALSYLGLWHLCDLQNYYAEQEYREGD